MKTKITILFTAFLAFVLFTSCSNKSEHSAEISTITEKPVNIDSLNSLWETAWNTKNRESIANQLSDSCMIFDVDWIGLGKDSALTGFVDHQLPNCKSIKTEKVVEVAGSDIAYRSGKWTLEFVKSDSSTGSVGGLFTLLWKKQADNSWKVSLLHTSMSL